MFFFTFSGLLKHYNTSHPDYQSTNTAMVKIQSVIRKMSVKLRESVSISHNWLSKSAITVLTIIIIYQLGKLCETGRITTWSWGLWAFVASWKRISKRRLPTKAVKERIPTENVLLGKYFLNILTVFSKSEDQIGLEKFVCLLINILQSTVHFIIEVLTCNSKYLN